VLENGVVVGRIQGRAWMWASGHNGEISRAAHGYEPTREVAMAAFAKIVAAGVGKGMTGGMKKAPKVALDPLKILITRPMMISRSAITDLPPPLSRKMHSTRVTSF
jgi:hypothetical protein